jgi:L-ribulose-5-phosphate 3-epimerase
MTISRREALQLATAAMFAPRALDASQPPRSDSRPRIKVAVSTYSYWHFRTPRYPIERVIDDAARLGFDGVEILHRQMTDESPAYVNGLKQRAFRNGLDLPMLSIHQDFISPKAEERNEAVAHTKKCIELAVEHHSVVR